MAINSFPPLISDSSSDKIGMKQLYGNNVLSSCIIRKEPGDLFFYPENGLTGYGYDGKLYSGGTIVPGIFSSWYSEGTGSYRGSLQTFPLSALVLITDVSMAIYDQSTDLNTWMIFLRKDQGMLLNNYDASTIGFTPKSVQYNGGVITVEFSPDPGSTRQTNIFLHIDFVQDTAYADVPHYPVHPIVEVPIPPVLDAVYFRLL